MISPIAGITKLKPGHATLPLKGIDPVLMDEQGQIITETVASGNLCLRAPWPSPPALFMATMKDSFKLIFQPIQGITSLVMEQKETVTVILESQDA